MVNRLIKPDSGRIEVDGRSVLQQNPQDLRRSIGYTVQGIGLFPHVTVADNISIVLRLCAKSCQQRRDRAREMLEMVKVDPDK